MPCARADLAHPGEVAGRGDDDAGLALDRLGEEGDGVRPDRRLERVGVAEGDGDEAGDEGAEVAAGVLVGRERHDAEGAAVEVARADDDLGAVLRHALHLVAPFAHRLDRRLDRLGARVHRQDLVRVGQVRELLVEAAELVVAEGAAGQGQARGLLGQRLQDLRVAVALVDRRVGGEAVEVAAALDVGHPGALALGQHDVEGLVVVRAEAGLEVDQSGGVEHGGKSWHRGQAAETAPGWRSSTVRPNRLATSSVAAIAVRPRSSRKGLSSTTSTEPTRPESQSISITRCASR